MIVFSDGGYRYIKAVFQYSSGAAAEPGFEIERARRARALPLAEMDVRGAAREVLL